jgi:DNA modification methylase
MDFFGGSGTTAYVAMTLGRRFLTVDKNKEAFEVMKKRIGLGLLDSKVEYVDTYNDAS